MSSCVFLFVIKITKYLWQYNTKDWLFRRLFFVLKWVAGVWLSTFCLFKQDVTGPKGSNTTVTLRALNATYGFWELTSRFHNSQAKRNNFCCEEEIDNLCFISLEKAKQHLQIPPMRNHWSAKWSFLVVEYDEVTYFD